jgi:hypothetical protein
MPYPHPACVRSHPSNGGVRLQNKSHISSSNRVHVDCAGRRRRCSALPSPEQRRQIHHHQCPPPPRIAARSSESIRPLVFSTSRRSRHMAPHPLLLAAASPPRAKKGVVWSCSWYE